MKISGSSLSGKNSRRRASGSGSRPDSPTLLFQRLRKLDREISALDYAIRLKSYVCYSSKSLDQLIDKRSHLDAIRAIVRNKRKAKNKPLTR